MKQHSTGLMLFAALWLLCQSASVYSGSRIFQADNYWQCILDDMPGVENDTAAEAILNQCQAIHPWSERLFIEKKRPWFGVKTATDCTVKYARSTPSSKGADAIQAACYKLYPRD